MKTMRTAMRAAMKPPRGEDGSLMLLIIGYFAIAALALTVVVNASRVFLAQRALVSAADGAAQVAAQAVDEAAVYHGATGHDLPLHHADVAEVVQAYAAEHLLGERFRGFQIADVAVHDDRTVTVTFRTKVSLPFLEVVSADRVAGVGLSATAKARMPLRP